jgi:hypothetical protein
MYEVYVIMKENKGRGPDFIFAMCESFLSAKTMLAQLKADKHYNFYRLQVFKIPLNKILVEQMPVERDPNRTIPWFKFGEIVDMGPL